MPQSDDHFEASSVSAVTALLCRASAGDPAAREAAYRVVREELRRVAARNMSRADQVSLQASMIVNDVWLKLIESSEIEWDNREQFFGFAARIVRQLLIDHARTRTRQKRGGKDRPVDIGGVAEPAGNDTSPSENLEKSERLLALNTALDQLEREHPELAQVVELYHFGGWSAEQIGRQILNLHSGTVDRRLSKARTLLHFYMTTD